MPRPPLSHYLETNYPFRVEADPEGGFVIWYPDLPGCMTQVESVEEIGPMAEEARKLWIETEYDEGEEIPEPSHPPRYSGKFNLRLPKSLHARLAASAEREGVSLNQYVVHLLSLVEGRGAFPVGFPTDLLELLRAQATPEELRESLRESPLPSQSWSSESRRTTR